MQSPLVRVCCEFCDRAAENWRALSCFVSMPGFTTAEVLAGLIFGSIGFVAFIYGKRRDLWKPMFTGIALMAYPYFITDAIALYSVGAALTATLLIFR